MKYASLIFISCIGIINATQPMSHVKQYSAWTGKHIAAPVAAYYATMVAIGFLQIMVDDKRIEELNTLNKKSSSEKNFPLHDAKVDAINTRYNILTFMIPVCAALISNNIRTKTPATSIRHMLAHHARNYSLAHAIIYGSLLTLGAVAPSIIDKLLPK